jgi:hypothetical protein
METISRISSMLETGKPIYLGRKRFFLARKLTV